VDSAASTGYRLVVRRVDIGLPAVAMVASIITVVALSEPFRLWLRSFWPLIAAGERLISPPSRDQHRRRVPRTGACAGTPFLMRGSRLKNGASFRAA
jgi:hypothetical protein